MYFDINYLEKLDNHLNDQIKSYNDIFKDKYGKYILIKNKKYYLPKLPDFNWLKNKNEFIEGLINNKTFIN